MSNRFSLTDDKWLHIEPLCLGKSGDRGKTGTDNRLFIEAVIHVGRTGLPWRDLPKEFGNWNSIYKRFSRWSEAKVWEKIFAAVSEGGDFELVAMDSTIVRAHQHAHGAQKKRVINALANRVAGPQPKSIL
jgi:transposase